MQLSRTSTVAAGVAALLMVCADGYAIAARMQQLTSPPLSAAKLAGAVILQVAIVVGVCAYVAWLQSRSRLELPPYGPFDAWRSRLLPILSLALLGAFSATLFYNGAVCGDKPLPTVRGVGLCG
jgi:tetrahydromethanopterin S-methyltransferase subunit E